MGRKMSNLENYMAEYVLETITSPGQVFEEEVKYFFPKEDSPCRELFLKFSMVAMTMKPNLVVEMLPFFALIRLSQEELNQEVEAIMGRAVREDNHNTQ